MGFAGLHIHSLYSWDGTCAVSAVLEYAAERAFLNVIAITDHSELAGALEVVAQAESLQVAWLGNSDAHFLTAIGQGATQVLGRTAADLRQAMPARTTRPIQLLSYRPTSYVSKWLPRYLLCSAG